MNNNIKIGASLITGVCATITVMNALNGALNYATGTPGDEKQKNLIFSIGMIAVGAAVGAFIGKRTGAFLDGCERVGQAVNNKIANDIAMEVESEPIPDPTPVSNEDWTQFQEDMKDWSYVEPTDANKED